MNVRQMIHKIKKSRTCIVLINISENDHCLVGIMQENNIELMLWFICFSSHESPSSLNSSASTKALGSLSLFVGSWNWLCLGFDPTSHSSLDH